MNPARLGHRRADMVTFLSQWAWQVAFQHIRARGVPRLFAFPCPYRTRLEGAVLKGKGVVARVRDIILIDRAREFVGLR
jgi:hypothetical protein